MLFGLYYGVSGLKCGQRFQDQWKSYNDDVQALRAKYSNDCVLLGDLNARIGKLTDVSLVGV
jgi:hypothetical protein